MTEITNAIPESFDNHRMQRTGLRELAERLNPDKMKPSDYQELVELYLTYRKPYADRWLENERLYENSPQVVKDPEEKISRLGRAFGVVQTTAATLYNKQPKIYCEPLDADYDEAILFELLANNDWTYSGSYADEMSNCVVDGGIYGIMGAITSYDADFETVLRRMNKRRKEVDQAVLAGTTEERVSLVREMLAEELHAPESDMTWEIDERVREQKVVTRRVSPWDLIGDPTASRFMVGNWISGRRVFIPMWDLKKGPFENWRTISPSHTVSEKYFPPHKRRGPKSETAEGKEDLRDWVEAFELFDHRSNRLIVIATDHDKFLRNDKNPYWTIPMKVRGWNDRGEGIFPRSELEIVSGLIEEEEILRAKLREALEREAIDVIFVDDTSGIGEEDIEPWKAPDGSYYIPIKFAASEGKALQNLFYRVPRESKAIEILQHIMRIERDIEIAVGLGQNQMGMPMKSGTSASESMEVASFVRTKAEFKFRSVERFSEQVTFDRLSMYAQFFDERAIRHVIGVESALKWAKRAYTKGDFQNRFAVKVEEGSMAPQSDMNRQNLWMQIFKFYATVPGLQQTLDGMEIIKRLLYAFGVKDGDPIFRVQDPNEMAQMMSAMAGQGPAGPRPTQEGGAAMGMPGQGAGATMGAMLGAA